MPIFSCAAILFDLDGVLCDSTRAVDREWREWAARKGVDGDAIMAIAHGVRTVEVIRRVAPHLDAEAEAAAIESHEAIDHRGVVVMPGAIDLVKSIPDGRWGVVTSGTRPLATNRLQYCGLPVPDVLVTSDDVTNGKPHPEPYLKGAEGLGLLPAECLVIEDAPAGIQSARAGGMKVIGLASTYGAEKLAEADAVVQKLERIQVNSEQLGRLSIEVNDWNPLSRMQLDEMLSLELASLPPDAIEIYKRCAIDVVQQPCFRRTEYAVERVFVIARDGRRLLFFDDVEDEFAIGVPDDDGILREEKWGLYGELVHALRGLKNSSNGNG